MVGCKLNLGIEQFGSVQNNTPPPSENMQKIIAFAPIDVMKMITGRKINEYDNKKCFSCRPLLLLYQCYLQQSDGRRDIVMERNDRYYDNMLLLL